MAKTDIATFAGGCFWCLESAFNNLKGVISAYSGYSNGKLINPSYEQVCAGTSGHAEVVQITFNSQLISYRELLEVFFALHNPTQLNRQGNDVGSQYRSAVYYHDNTQKQLADEIIQQINEQQIWPEPIVTEVVKLDNYYQAEDYHQNYFINNPQNGYCGMVVAPKLAKFKQTFAAKLKS